MRKQVQKRNQPGIAIGTRPFRADVGFPMLYGEDRSRVLRAMSRAGLEDARFRFNFEGAKVLMG